MINQSTIARPIETLAQACVFKGERIQTLCEMTGEEAIRLSTHLISKGDETKARGVYVFAATAKAISDEKEAKAFMASLRAEFINTAKEKAEKALPANASKVAKDGALAIAEKEGIARFQNMGQAIRAARFVLDNPGKVADSVSVFTVTQANAFLALPELASDADATAKAAHAEKAAIQSAVLPLLKKGASQAAVKKAIADKKEELEKAKEAAKPVDTRTDAEKAEAARINEVRHIVTRVVNTVGEWEKLIAGGMKADALRAEPISRNTDGSMDKAQGTLRDRIAILARLAGLEVK